MASNSRHCLSIEEKFKVLEALKSKTSEAVAKEFGIGLSTVYKIKKDGDYLQKEASTNSNLKRKRNRESPNEEIGKALIAWFHQTRSQNASISGPLMLEKAKQLAITLSYHFEPSSGWLERLKTRHNIKFGSLTSCDSVQRNRSDGVKDGDLEAVPRVSHKEALHALSVIRKYLEENFPEYESYYEIEDIIEKHALEQCAQSKITDFFKK